MEKVLKRVGLAKRSSNSAAAEAVPEEHGGGAGGAPGVAGRAAPSSGTSKQSRRRRRSKSRRRAHNNADAKKTRGLFNIDWDSVRDCKSCKSRAITRRFCTKKCDNELYRSNSFKFERFVRGNDDASTLERKIPLCDDYSLPLDHLNKKRPNSIAIPNISDWNISSSNEEKVKILETYSTPRDSRQQLSQEDQEQKCFTSPDREYSQPYTTDGSSSPSSDEFFGHQINVTQAPVHPLELNSPDSIAEAILPLVNAQSPIRADIKRHPSPYYYSDLYKPRVAESPSKPAGSRLTESATSSRFEKQARTVDSKQSRTVDGLKNENRKKSWGGYHKKYRRSSSLERTLRAKSNNQENVHTLKTPISNDNQLDSPCACVDHDDVVGDDMSRQRHLYETAFDCRISKSDDDLDKIDKVTNHPVLTQLHNSKPEAETSESRVRSHSSKTSLDDNHPSISGISQKLEEMHLLADSSCTNAALPLRGYTPSPPSTAPLPTKFHGKEMIMNSIRSAPNLPSHSKARLKHMHLPIKSLRGFTPTSSSSAFDIQHTNSSQYLSDRAEQSNDASKSRVMEIKDRPRKDFLLFKRSKDSKGTITEFKGRRRRRKYSSSESMTTSSSGSMESIKSSTSEGNRSTTSTESRNSSSLSSHDSDSGAARNFLAAQTASFHAQATKLHILSPISDKSSQEPVSDISDNNRNNNSQKCSPDEVEVMVETVKTRRRAPQNRNLVNLGFHGGDLEMQGSDSGISIQSREGVKSKFGLAIELAIPGQSEFTDLPFDMPKLRRRRIAAQEACTSGSATSIDFGELPFDMPKLRRRLRIQQSLKDTCVSQASSSQSVADHDVQAFRPKLTLNLSDISTKQRTGLGLSLFGVGVSLNAAKSPTGPQEIVDINLPLEKQGWFHGAITRVEAENVLRLLREGSFLVRNSESTKQDYSLSLKSARGFMHMRIQRDETTGVKSFILGQFSKPFSSIPEMIRHFSLNSLPIRGAEHMCLIQPVIAQLL